MLHFKEYSMKKLHGLIVGSMLIFPLFYSCTKEKLVNYDDRIIGTVTDSYTHEPVAGAVVRYHVNGIEDSVFTDTTGYYLIKGLNPGGYMIVCSKPGYAESSVSMTTPEYYNTPTSSNGGNLVEYTMQDISLYQRTVTIKGVVKIRLGPNNELRPASNFNYSLYINNYYVSPNAFQGTTNTLGEFTITDVPVYDYLNLHFAPKSEWTRYYTTTTSFYHIPPNSTAEITTVLNTYSGPILALMSTNMDSTAGGYQTSFPVADDIQLTFNKDLSLEYTKSYGGFIKLNTYTYNLDTQVVFNGSTVTINPPVNLTNNQLYNLTYTIYSTDPGDAASGSIFFHTAM